MIDIRFEGMPELLAKLRKLGRLEKVKAAIKAAALHVKGKINVYPGATEANQPNTRGRWYARGYGPRWMTREGVHGRKTSETLGRKWTTVTTHGGWGAVVGNNVSYSPWVHDPEKQASFHKARGWKTTQEVADQETATVTQFVEDAVRQEIREAGLD